MSEILSLLQPLKDRLTAATPGPWELLGGGEWISPIGITVAPDDGGIGPRDAELIANAPTDQAKLIAAIEAAGALHEQGQPGDYEGPDGQRWYGEYCTHCHVEWPCETAAAIAQALGGDTA